MNTNGGFCCSQMTGQGIEGKKEWMCMPCVAFHYLRRSLWQQEPRQENENKTSVAGTTFSYFINMYYI